MDFSDIEALSNDPTLQQVIAFIESNTDKDYYEVLATPLSGLQNVMKEAAMRFAINKMVSSLFAS